MARDDIGDPVELTRYAVPTPEVDPDLAGEIVSEVVHPRSVWATQCEFDGQGDLVYGEGVELQARDEFPVELKLPDRGRYFDTSAHVVSVEEDQWRLATVFVCQWPYELNVRGLGRLRPHRSHGRL